MFEKKFAVILSGCGNRDGSEIHESTMAMLAIDMAGGIYECFAPDIEQAKVINFINGNIMSVHGDRNNRNVLEESARIARGDIKDLSELDVGDFDAIVFPGGLGAVQNWCDYALKGIACKVNPTVEKIILSAHEEGVVIGAMCIAPVLIAKVLGRYGVEVTVGNDPKTSSDIQAMGAVHMRREATDVYVDNENKVVTTPAYMLCDSIKEVHEGANNFIQAIMDLL